ncbi:MAG: thiopurine S-methyltransferase [Pseudomonadota bacterium]
MSNPWLQRWAANQIGWHESQGNRHLKKHWNESGRRVLVPLCGKSVDLRWLLDRDNTVVGVELADVAARAFFHEQSLPFERVDGALPEYRTLDQRLRIVVGDFFAFEETGFDGVFDRGALIALPPELRYRYVQHLEARLEPGAAHLLVTLEYPQAAVKGPPFAVMRDEVLQYYPNLRLLTDNDDLPNAPPKFRDAGVPFLRELVWRRGRLDAHLGQ